MSLVTQTGQALRMLRKRAGLTQKEVAERAAVSKNIMSNWETGVTAASISSLGKAWTCWAPTCWTCTTPSGC